MTTSERSEILNEAIVCLIWFIGYGIFAYFVCFVFSDYYTGFVYALFWDDEPRGWLHYPIVFAFAYLPLGPFFIILKHFVDSYELIKFRYRRNANEHGKEKLL